MNPILLERDGAIATVTLNNPEKLNALHEAMWRGLRDTLRELGSDETLRCVVLRGAGEKAFAAGADIAEFAAARANAAQAKSYGNLVHEAMQAVARCTHLTVAMIRGACIGGGLEIAAMCDLRVCGAGSRFVERLTPRVDVPPQEWDEGFACFDTADYREGVSAFLAKRKPAFSGR